MVMIVARLLISIAGLKRVQYINVPIQPMRVLHLVFVSMLSGLLPQQHGVRLLNQILEKDVALLPKFLPDEYQTAAFVSNIVLTDEALGIATVSIIMMILLMKRSLSKRFLKETLNVPLMLHLSG